MNNVDRSKMELRVQFTRENPNVLFTEDIYKYAQWLEDKLSKQETENNCVHNWSVDNYDKFGFPASQYCDKCNTREII